MLLTFLDANKILLHKDRLPKNELKVTITGLFLKRIEPKETSFSLLFPNSIGLKLAGFSKFALFLDPLSALELGVEEEESCKEKVMRRDLSL